MSDSMGKEVFEAAMDGKEAELRRLIERGGSVNWHNPEVRRRMSLAWAPARRRGLCCFASATEALPDTTPSPHTSLAARRASALASPPPRRHAELGTRLLDVRGAPHAPLLPCRLVSHRRI